MSKIDDFLSLILQIVERPGMYGVNELDDLYFIMLGYMYSDIQEMSEISDLLEKFRLFINEHFESNEGHDWHKLVKLYSGSDIHSIELFGRLFNQYLRSIHLSMPDS